MNYIIPLILVLLLVACDNSSQQSVYTAQIGSPEANVNQQYIMFEQKDNKLHAEFKFADFTTAFAFMTEVAFLAEKQAHHPNWSNVYNTVTIDLTTHDAGNKVTDKDHKLAAEIERVYAKYKLK